MVFGYAYPAYECYKAIEKNKPEIQQLRFWCQYWFVICLFSLISSCLELFLLLKSKILIFLSKLPCRILVAALTIFERVGDTFASWLVLLNIELLSDEFEMYILMLFLSCFREGFRSTARQSSHFSYIFGSPRPE